MPADAHQVMSRFLLFALFAFIERLGGTVLGAPLRVQIREGKFCEPDLLRAAALGAGGWREAPAFAPPSPPPPSRPTPARSR